MEIERDFARLTEKFKSNKKIEIPLRSPDSEEALFVQGLVVKGLTYCGPLQMARFLNLALRELVVHLDQLWLKRVFYSQEKIDILKETAENRRAFAACLAKEALALRRQAQSKAPGLLFQAHLKADLVEFQLICQFAFTPAEIENFQATLLTRDSHLHASELKEESQAGLLLAGKALYMAGVLPQIQTAQTSLFQIGVGSRASSPVPIERARQYIDEIEHLPDFPDNIRRIMLACEDEKSDARSVAAEIARDPAIASAIIRLANSGGFAGGHVADLLEAVKIVGIRNISGLLLNVGALGILEAKFGFTEEMRDHPIKVARYSRFLARKYKLARLADAAYVGGLLHDIGMIVLLARMAERKTFDQALDLEPSYRLPIEEMACGINHAELGAMLARKWNFPEHLAQVIEHHHAPYQAEAEFHDLVQVVYLANAMADYEAGKINFYTLEPTVLNFFALTSRQAFEMLLTLIQNQSTNE